MKNTIRVICALLAIMMLVTLAVSCAETKTTDDKETTAETKASGEPEDETEEGDALEQRKNVSDDLPEYDADGATFKLAINASTDDYIMTSEDAEDVVDEAVYKRNSSIESRFNCEITVVYDSGDRENYTETSNMVLNSVNSGDDTFDLVASHVVAISNIVLNNVFYNWNDLEYTNFDKPWWAACTTETLTYRGKTLLAVGDVALSSIYETYCMFYNKDLGENYNLPSIYDIIEAGEWTIDKQISLTKDIYEDVNNDGQKDVDDFYGFETDASSNVIAYLWAFDNPIMTKNSDGDLEFSINTTRMPDIVTTILDMFDYNGCFTFFDNDHHVFQIEQFNSDKVIFINGMFKFATSQFRDFKGDYAIIPYPKWNEEQESYYTMVDGGHHALGVSIVETTPDFVSLITEALCAESYKQVVPAYYDVALKVKGTRDEESVAMLDLIMETRAFDFGYVYNGWSGASFWMQNLIQNQDSDWVSFYEKNSPSVITYYEKVIDFFDNL